MSAIPPKQSNQCRLNLFRIFFLKKLLDKLIAYLMQQKKIEKIIREKWKWIPVVFWRQIGRLW